MNEPHGVGMSNAPALAALVCWTQSGRPSLAILKCLVLRRMVIAAQESHVPKSSRVAPLPAFR